MTEEVKVEVKPEEVKPEEVVVVEPTEVELQATEQGWVPKAQWEADGKSPDEWRPAKEFVDRGELFKTIHQTKRDLKQTQAALTALQRHHQYVFEKAHLQAITDLKKEKRQAIQSEDLEKVSAIDEEIEQVQTQFQQDRGAMVQAQAQAQVGPPPEFEAWKADNRWYDADQDMREYADATGFIYMSKTPNARPEDVLKYIDQKIKKQYPEKFGSQRKTAPSPTATADKTATRQVQKKDEVLLDEMETEIMKTLVRSGVLTEAEYKDQLKKARGK